MTSKKLTVKKMFGDHAYATPGDAMKAMLRSVKSSSKPKIQAKPKTRK